MADDILPPADSPYWNKSAPGHKEAVEAVRARFAAREPRSAEPEPTSAPRAADRTSDLERRYAWTRRGSAPASAPPTRPAPAAAPSGSSGARVPAFDPKHPYYDKFHP